MAYSLQIDGLYWIQQHVTKLNISYIGNDYQEFHFLNIG